MNDKTLARRGEGGGEPGRSCVGRPENAAAGPDVEAADGPSLRRDAPRTLRRTGTVRTAARPCASLRRPATSLQLRKPGAGQPSLQSASLDIYLRAYACIALQLVWKQCLGANTPAPAQRVCAPLRARSGRSCPPSAACALRTYTRERYISTTASCTGKELGISSQSGSWRFRAQMALLLV